MHSATLLLSFILLAFALPPTEGYKILVTAMGISTSHNLIMYRLADLIASRGNDVTVLQWAYNPIAKAPSLKHAKEMKYTFPKQEAEMREILATSTQMPWEKKSIFKMDTSIMKRGNRIMVQGCADFLNDTTHPVYQTLFTEKYDVVVLHMLDVCGLGVTELVKNPSRIWFSLGYLPDIMAHYSGVPYPTSYVPAALTSNTDKMSLMQRVFNFFPGALMRHLFEYGTYGPITEIFRQKAGPDFPDITDLYRETQLYFLNADPFFEYSRPSLQNMIYVGGLTMDVPEPLDAQWQKIMNESSENGVVIFSMGSVASTKDMPFAMKTALINGFSHFPKYTFLVRLEGELPKLSDNIRLVEWIPQKDLLAHPKIKAFFTHGGYNSLTEATYAGVPLVVMPLFSGQFANAKRVERSGIGVAVDKENLTEQSVVDVLTKVLEDGSYNEKAKRLSRMMKEKPTSSADLAVGWVEYLAKFKTVDNLLPESRHMGFIQYYSLDVLAILTSCLLLIVYISYRLLRLCFSSFCRLFRSKGHSKVD